MEKQKVGCGDCIDEGQSGSPELHDAGADKPYFECADCNHFIRWAEPHTDKDDWTAVYTDEELYSEDEEDEEES